MAINLSKGGRVDLNKEAPGLNKIKIGLGWDTNATDTGDEFDLDASVFMVDSSKKVPSENYFIFYNNLKSPDESLIHEGDNRTGEGEGDDESIIVDLSQVSENIQELIFVVTIHDSEARKQNFGQVSNAFIRIVDALNDKEILKYDLDEDFSTETAIEFGRLYRKDGSWRFQAIGTGFSSGLQGFVNKYIG